MKSKILIFSATYNETENIEDFLNLIDELNLELDILLIDDNSPDNTWRKIEEYSKNRENIHLIIRNKKEGLDTAHKIAYEYSIKNNYDLAHNLYSVNENVSEENKSLDFEMLSHHLSSTNNAYLLSESNIDELNNNLNSSI